MATAPATLIKNLDIASQRIKKGNTYSGYATDVKNLNYAKSRYGYSYKPQTSVTPDTPVPGDQLGQPNPYEDISKIIGTKITPDMVSPEIAGLLAIQNQTTESQKQYADTQNDLLEQIKQLGGQGADMQAELERQGVNQAYQQVKELNLRGAQLQGQIEKFDVDTAKQSEALGEQAIPTGLISGQQSQLQRNRDLTKAGMAAELGATAALSQAYQGNAQLGTQLAQQAVDLKYQPMLNNLEVLKTQLSFAGEKMTKDDQKRANVINAIIAEQQEKITTQKELENQIQSIAIEAATNGAPTHVVTAIKGAASAVDAVKVAQKYLTSNVQRQQQLADEERAFGREKELIRYRESFQESSGPDTSLLDSLLGKKFSAAEQLGFSRVPKADGGFDFYQNGQPITVEQYGQGTGIAKKEALEGSSARQDAQANLSPGQKTQFAETNTLLDQVGAALTLGESNKWSGIGGFKLGSAKGFLQKNLGRGKESDERLRTKIAQVQATIAKLRGGTSFTPNEQKLLEQYTPTINMSGKTARIRLQELQSFLKRKNDDLIYVSGGGQSSGGRPDLSDLEGFIIP